MNEVKLRLCTVVATLFASRAALAEEQRLETTRPDERANRTLAEHTFIPIGSVVWPFVQARFYTSTSLGQVSVPLSASIADQLVSGDAEFVSLTQDFNLQVAFTKWIGIEASLLGRVVGGVNDVGGLLIGFNGAYGGGLNVVLRLLELDRFYLSLRVGGSGSRSDGIVPSRLVEVGDDGNIRIATRRPRLTGSVGEGTSSLTSAIALTKWLGVQLSVSGDVQRINFAEFEDTVWSVSGGGGVSINLASLRIPIAIIVGGHVDHAFDSDVSEIQLPSFEPDSGTTGEVEAGIYYARDDFEIGLASITGVGGDVDRFIGSIRAGFYW